MTVSDRFVLFMRELGVNQKDLAAQIDYPRTNLSNFVNGNVKSPKIDLVVALANHFPQLNLNWLLTGTGTMWKDDYVKSGQKKEDVKVPATGLAYLGEGMDTNLINELLETKDQLIESQQKQISQLEKEVERLKGK